MYFVCVCEGGREHALAVPVRAPDQPQVDRVEPSPGESGAELAQRVPFRHGGHHGVVAVAVDKVVEGGAATDPEHRVRAAPDQGVKEYEREVSPVEDHDVARLQGVEMGECRGPLVGVGRQTEVDRRPRVQSVEAGNQPLRVVGRRSGNRVAGLGQRVGQAHLGSVDGERAVARDLSVESQLDIAFRDPPSNSAPRGVDLG